MTNEEAIKYLKQLYPNDGHCWLDEQRIEAIGMAIQALQNLSNVQRTVKNWKEPVSEELEEAATSYATKEYYKKNQSSLPQRCIGCYAPLMYAFRAGAEWQMAQMIKDSTDITVHIDAGGYPYIPQIELYNYDKDIPLAKEGDKYKVVLIETK